eukprot:TRINITY_DN49241_c0_g1_i1.p1 TRINITY_DN49241_c0_g1~~TRINITY_DN49241_c0_g1_i1.p1  ORF type:complete len:183 (-),score=38.00 TRINITY_DN49241_c0_g1_i1:104-652(-)
MEPCTSHAAGDLAVLVGNASTAEELRACKIGGCCGKNASLLPRDAISERLCALPQWKLSDDGAAISREFVAKHWQAAMNFINQVSVIAEEEGHHPDLHITSWRNVRVDVSTHDVGGLTISDFVLAAKIDSVEVEYSPKWFREKMQALKLEQVAVVAAGAPTSGAPVANESGASIPTTSTAAM